MVEFRLSEEYDTCLEKPNGEVYHKFTRNEPDMDLYTYISRKQFVSVGMDDYFYQSGLYNQYNHKFICTTVQLRYYICDDFYRVLY